MRLPAPPERENKGLTWPMRTSSSQAEGATLEFAVLTQNFPATTAGRKSSIASRSTRGSSSPGIEFDLDAELVLPAMGFVHPVHEGLLKLLGVDLDRRGNIRANLVDYQTSRPI